MVTCGNRVVDACVTPGSIGAISGSCREVTLVPCNGWCCAWCTGWPHFGTDNAPSQGCSPPGISPPVHDGVFSVSGRMMYTKACEGESDPPYTLVPPFPLLLQSPCCVHFHPSISDLYLNCQWLGAQHLWDCDQSMWRHATGWRCSQSNNPPRASIVRMDQAGSWWFLGRANVSPLPQSAENICKRVPCPHSGGSECLTQRCKIPRNPVRKHRQ